MTPNAPGAGSDPPLEDPLEAAAEALFMQLRLDKSRKWSDLDLEPAEHYRAAARRTISVFRDSSAAGAAIAHCP